MKFSRLLCPGLILLGVSAGCFTDQSTPSNNPTPAASQTIRNADQYQTRVEIVGVYRKPDLEFVREKLKPMLTDDASGWSFGASGSSATFESTEQVDLERVADQLQFGKVVSIEGNTLRVVFREKDYQPLLPEHRPEPGSWSAAPADPLGPALAKNNGDWEAALKEINASFRLDDQGEIIELKPPSFTISNDTLKHVAELTSLRKLDLSMCKHIGDEGAAHLAGLTQLEDLNLFGTDVGNLGQAHLAGLTKLRRLGLSGSGSDEALRHLEGLQNLEKLSVGYGIGYPVTAERLQHLAGMKQLEYLRLDGCQVSDDGLAIIAGFKELTSLQLGNGTMTDAGLHHLSELTNLKSLSLRDCSNVTDVGMPHLQRLVNLTYLNLGGTQVGDQGLDHLDDLTQLSSFNLSETNISDAGVKSIGPRPRLRQLILDGTDVSDASLEYIATFPDLDNIWLSNTKITDAGLAHLGSFTQLKTLYLNNTAITDAGMAELAGLKDLRSLGIAETSVTLRGLRHLKDCEQLRDIRIEDSGVTPEELRSFREQQ